MPDLTPELLTEIRARFAHVETCPFEGERVFFENAGGALTLNSVVETSARLAAIPDNQGRDNGASRALQQMIDDARADMQVFFNTPDRNFFVGESGTELLFRLIRAACLGTPAGRVIGSSLEHPATRSACDRWTEAAGKPYTLVAHDNATGSVSAEAYAAHLTPDTAVATIVHTSPVTGMGVDVAAIARQIRAVAPGCIIIVDGIQHAAHGRLDIASYDIDGYVVSPYKVFSRHGYGLAWTSDRLSALPHDHLTGAPTAPWELGTRDTGAYANFSDVVGYFDWLGAQLTDSDDRRARIVAAGEAIHAQEARLAQELALIAVKADLTEELDRLEGHVAAARQLLAETGPVGRKFDFLTQEFNREANTLCSKAQAGDLTAIGLEMKVVIDQMREQVQNVE